ncbi:MAG: PBP1A family penicillin-binding protein [Candidatus Nitrohelix vancouverensis]|uniref:PBP1A family penicillin-binding protein n=1 Tax=Candidatus Nitrohelix vancouverensis TaxID=2705534 RepID=A0A7T0G3M4_9BACT|nr:MAG: PBP1A family penicillin-binding protein [Candidatus Nitrohelix vancouverensis]
MIRRIAQNLLFAVYAFTLLGVLTLCGLYFELSDDLPQLPENLDSINLSLPTEIYSVDGEQIKVVGQRFPVNIEDVAPHFLKAIISVEDGNFYEHSGLDHIGLARALLANLKEGRIRQGGSTITQQLSKNLFFSFERNWIRKIKELLIALQLEATFTKDEILQAYCNQIYFGNGAYGVEEAAQTYFAKRAKDLTLLQAALLAGLPNSPNNANPFSNYERAMSRARYVLERMVITHAITRQQKAEAENAPLELASPKVESDVNMYFVNHVLNRLEKDYGREFVYFGGLKIFTTLDTRLQRDAESAAKAHLEKLEKRLPRRPGKGPLQTALAAVENKSGAVRAMLGGRDFSVSQFNRAVSNNRLPGSSFKPFVYFTAMEQLGYSPATLVVDEPTQIPIPGTDTWEPQNFSHEFVGPLVLKKALMHSINVVAAKLIEAVGPEKVIATARQFGITSPLGKHYSLALGTSGVSPLEMAGAYSVIANLGIYNEPYIIRRIEDYDGNRLYEHFYEGVQRFPQKSIYPLLDMMQGVVEEGTGRVVRRLKFDHPAAGKTGTTNDFKDAWFDGFTKDLSVSVWVGYDDNEPMLDNSGRGLTGAGAAAPIWAYFMQNALDDHDRVNFPVPTGIKRVEVDVDRGTQVSKATTRRLTVAVKEETIIPEYVAIEDEQAPVEPSPLDKFGDDAESPDDTVSPAAKPLQKDDAKLKEPTPPRPTSQSLLEQLKALGSQGSP